MGQIVGFQDIVGLANGSEYGPSEVAGTERSTVLYAKDLPKSMVGIPVTTMDPGEAEDIEIDVQREFRPDRLMLVSYPNNTGDAGQQDLMRVIALNIGDTNLNASPNTVPIACFSPAAVGTSIRAPRTTDPSLGLLLQVENANVAAGEDDPVFVCSGAIFGPSARPGAGAGGKEVSGIIGAANDDASDPASASMDDAKNLPQSFVGIPPTQPPTLAFQRVSINCRVFRDIRPDRLCVGFGGITDWFIRDVRVGTTSLNASTNPIPGICFANLSFGNRLRATVTASTSVGITIDAWTNVAAAAASPLCGAFFGPSRFPA